MQKKPRGSEAIKVVFRVRPLNPKEIQDGRRIAAIAHEDRGIIEIRNPALEGGVDSSKTFTFDAVFSEKSTQQHIYDVSAAPVVQSVLEGFNGTIFAYGQTGAGKTHTMEGINEPAELRGIIPSAFEHIFDHIALNSSKNKYLVRASYFEIYNEEIRDLLSQNPRNNLELKESVDSGVYVKDLIFTAVKSVSEIDNVLQRGKKNRSVGATLMNAGSSRSHSIFSIVVECCSIDGKNEHIRAGKLNLVDLAGSERQSKTGATGERLKEATKINLSLSALGNVISALADGKSRHVPYRDSKLTRILQDSLGGNTKTVMCANAGPADYNYDESLSTLRYANRAKNIKNRPVINEDPKDTMLREYQEEIARLKERLSLLPFPSNDMNKKLSVNDSDRESLKNVHSEVCKDHAQARANTEAEIKKLRSDNDHTAAEREILKKKLEEEQKARIDTENERIKLQEQLNQMEAKVIIGGEAANNAAKQEAALRKAKQELIAKKEFELALTRKMNEQEEEKINLEEKYSSLSEEAASKTKKLKKVWTKYQQAKREIKDLEQELLADKNDLLGLIRDLTKQLKLKDFIISSFIPPTYALLFEDIENGGRSVWDDDSETWTIPSTEMVEEKSSERRLSIRGLSRSETEYARCRKLVDQNMRWRKSDIIDLEIRIPNRSTPICDDLNSAQKIRSILMMGLGETDDDLPLEIDNREKESQYFSLVDGGQESQKLRRRKGKAKNDEQSRKSSRPITAF